jgi:phage shock protein E
MEWVFIAFIAIFALGYLFLRRPGQIPVNEAHEYLRNGAVLVDVRTPAEFNARHLRNAINIPVDEIETSLPTHFANKNQPILLHCNGGRRSAVAKTKLNANGYADAHNLGSYTRAEHIVRSA